MAGDIVRECINKAGVNLLPVDSEHSALFHLLRGIEKKHIHKLIITASGGPFHNRPIGNPSVAERRRGGG